MMMLLMQPPWHFRPLPGRHPILRCNATLSIQATQEEPPAAVITWAAEPWWFIGGLGPGGLDSDCIPENCYLGVKPRIPKAPGPQIIN